MRKSLPVFTAAVLLLACTAVAALAADIYVSPSGTDPAGCVAYPNDGIGANPSPYQTIGKAVSCASPGDVIHVAAGTYAGPGGINTGLTLLGPNAAISPNGGPRVAEAVINSGSPSIRVGTTDPVVISGFKFDGTGVAVDSYTPLTHITLSKNIFVNTTAGAFFFNDPYLTFDDNYMSAINPGDECLFVAGNWNGVTGGMVTITNNVWENTLSTGMNLSSVRGLISGNRFTNVSYYAILLANTSGSISISNNTFQGIVNPDPLNVPTWGAGVRFYTPSFVGPVNITGNHFLGCFVGVGVRKGSPTADLTGMSIAVTGNDFVGNTSAGVYHDGLGTLNATCNWWGNLLGPNSAPANPSPGDKVFGPVTYAPWLNGAIPGGACNQYGANTVAANTSGLCISNAHICVTVPMVFNRLDPTPVRGYSVTFQLGGGLSLCGSITEDAYLNSHGGTNYLVTDNTGGSYTVDCAILGLTSGATGTGTLFDIPVTASGSGTGTITVTAVKIRDLNNGVVPGIPGAPSSIPIDHTGPAAIADVAAAQVTSGNSHLVDTTGVTISFTAPGDAATVEVYRAPFGGGVGGSYPLYTGSAPTAPSYAPTGPWVLTPVTVSGGVDHPPVRGWWYYVVFTKDGCGNVSAVSNMTGGCLNYHLGDVANGWIPGKGDNLVDTRDISALGGHYGMSSAGYLYLDVGPTTTSLPSGRPVPDARIDFEDLMMFAINYGIVSKPGLIGSPRSAADVLATDISENAGVITARLNLDGAGRIQGISTQFSWNPKVVEPAGFAAGDLLESLNGVAFSPAPGAVDAALLGARSFGLTGSGTLATVTFRRIGEGDPGIALARVDARDTKNRPVELATASRDAVTATRLLAPAPNPFRTGTSLQYSLATGGPVELSIYSVNGRRVRTLFSGTREAGNFTASWDGRDEAGQTVAQGVFFARLRTAQGTFARTLTYLR